MQWQPPHVVGKVFCVGERVQEPQCGKQQLIDLYELYQGAYVFNGSNSLQKNSGNSTKRRPSNVDSSSDDEQIHLLRKSKVNYHVYKSLLSGPKRRNVQFSLYLF